MNKAKGFTIIELLVVVAIIAVLTGIVLVNVTSYINKGKDAAIKGNMATMSTNAAVFYDNNSSTYVGFAASAGYTAPATAITSANAAPVTFESATAYCVKAALKDGTTWCVDHTGFKGTVNTATRCISGTIAC